MTEIDVINKAGIILGDRQITSRSEKGVWPETANAIYDGVRDAVLRLCPWNFARKRAILAADPTDPLWGEGNRYAYPADFLYMMESEDREDYTLEENFIIARSTSGVSDTALNIKYIKRVTDMSKADSLFVQALSLRLALDACEKITQSNTKKDEIRFDYEKVISDAKRLNGQEKTPYYFVEDTYITDML